MSTLTNKKERTQRVRFKLKKKENLRLSIFRSNKFLYAQLIDDSVGKTLFSSSSIQKEFKEIKGSPKEIAFKIGESIGDKILENKIIKKICFDRGGYLFHGRVKEFAMGVRSKGIKFYEFIMADDLKDKPKIKAPRLPSDSINKKTNKTTCS